MLIEEAKFKVCRNCDANNSPKTRKCHKCGGNKFDKPTADQQKAANDRTNRNIKLVKELGTKEIKCGLQ